MNGWSTHREVEKPKTLTGQRELAVTKAKEHAEQLRRRSDAAVAILGSNNPMTRELRDAAATIDTLVRLMPGAAKS